MSGDYLTCGRFGVSGESGHTCATTGVQNYKLWQIGSQIDLLWCPAMSGDYLTGGRFGVSGESGHTYATTGVQNYKLWQIGYQIELL